MEAEPVPEDCPPPPAAHGRCARRCVGVKAYSVLLAVILLVLNSMWTYRLGVLTTIEKRFKLSSAESGFTVSSFEIGHIGSNFAISYFGAHLHKPRLVALGGALCTVSGLLFAVPHVVYGSGRTTAPYDVNARAETLERLCEATVAPAAANGSGERCADWSAGGAAGDEARYGAGYDGAYVILVVSSVLLGVALVPMLTVGVTFIDDNVESEKFPVYYGAVMSGLLMGNISGFGAAAISTSIDIDLKPSVGVSRVDPRWLGAWWLGMVVMSALSVLPILAMAVFPDRLPDLSPAILAAQRSVRVKKKSAKGLLVSLGRLILSPVFMAVVVGYCCDSYISSGYLAFMPKFLEIQYNYSAYMANVISAFAFGITGCVGSFVGGLVCTRLADARRMCMFVIVCVTASAVAMAALAFVGCDNHVLAGDAPVAGSPFSIDTACNRHCDGGCGTQEMVPVCGADGATYFSPCHAGCSMVSADAQNYTSCSCAGWATAESCGYRCDAIGSFCCLLTIVIFLSTMAMPAAGAIVLRIVDKEERALALGVFSSFLSLFAYLPGPAIYGAAIDSACQVWQEACGGARGVCWWYDVTTYRYAIHGLTAAFKLAAVPAFVFLLCSIPRRDGAPSSNKAGQDDVMLKEVNI